MNKKRQFLLSAVLATTLAANAQVTIHVDASNPGIKVSPNLYGIFFEDINHAPRLSARRDDRRGKGEALPERCFGCG